MAIGFLKADICSGSPLSEGNNFVIHYDKGLTLEASCLKIFRVANLITLSIQLIVPNYLVILSHRHSTTVLPSFIHIFYLLLNYFKTILLFYFSNLFFFAIGDPICDLVRDLIQSDPGFVKVSPFLLTHSHNYFCMNMYHIIAVRFRC